MIPCEQCGEKFYDAYDHIKHGSEWACAKKEIETLKARVKFLEGSIDTLLEQLTGYSKEELSR